jgi:hypothetical protein
MLPCCPQYAAHIQPTQEDGFRIIWSHWEFPHATTTVVLVCADGRSVEINFCPWCGQNLKPVSHNA